MKAWLQKVAGDSANEVVMSVCTGAFKLAGAGLLDGKPATTHHGYYDEFEKYFPKVKLQKDARFVRSDERVFTSGGLTSGIDLALHVVELYFGRATADQYGFVVGISGHRLAPARLDGRSYKAKTRVGWEGMRCVSLF
jgi:transcriptional regulator GlxA family with amidase domain